MSSKKMSRIFWLNSPTAWAIIGLLQLRTVWSGELQQEQFRGMFWFGCCL